MTTENKLFRSYVYLEYSYTSCPGLKSNVLSKKKKKNA